MLLSAVCGWLCTRSRLYASTCTAAGFVDNRLKRQSLLACWSCTISSRSCAPLRTGITLPSVRVGKNEKQERRLFFFRDENQASRALIPTVRVTSSSLSIHLYSCLLGPGLALFDFVRAGSAVEQISMTTKPESTLIELRCELRCRFHPWGAPSCEVFGERPPIPFVSKRRMTTPPRAFVIFGGGGDQVRLRLPPRRPAGLPVCAHEGGSGPSRSGRRYARRGEGSHHAGQAALAGVRCGTRAQAAARRSFFLRVFVLQRGCQRGREPPRCSKTGPFNILYVGIACV